MATVTIREHSLSKKDSFGLVAEKSLNQDFVFVNDKLAGYLSHTAKKFMPVAGWSNDHNKMVCDAIQKIKGAEFGPITAIDAPEVPVIETTEDDE